MGACTVSLQRKPNSVAEFTETIEHDIFPLRRTQQGFQDEMAFVVPGAARTRCASVWGTSKRTRRPMPAAPLPTC
jgi:hypothetical protein